MPAGGPIGALGALGADGAAGAAGADGAAGALGGPIGDDVTDGVGAESATVPGGAASGVDETTPSVEMPTAAPRGLLGLVSGVAVALSIAVFMAAASGDWKP